MRIARPRRGHSVRDVGVLRPLARVVVARSMGTGHHETVSIILVVGVFVGLIWWQMKRRNKGAAIKLALWLVGMGAVWVLFSHAQP